MKKEFIMPSLEMKKFSREVVMDASLVPQNVEEAEKALKGNTSINQVAVITL
ncbi:MAG: hypothetical protein Q4G33_13030 [bacterium]|nr:hypothetical protein [bacterium]